jgi:cytochrome c553
VAGLVIGVLPPLAAAQQHADGAGIAASGVPDRVTACAACHGAGGEGNPAAGFPRLAGLAPAYLEEQLDNLAAGQRQNPVMGPIAKQLSAAERQAVAAYYGGLAAPPPLAAPADALKQSDTGAWLAERGRWDENLPACIQCHGPGGGGVAAAFPALAGQSATYIAAQLHAFKDGTRPGGPLGLMQAVAIKLSDADITAVAAHFSGAARTGAIAAQGKENQ